jgi:hypothetical protein
MGRPQMISKCLNGTAADSVDLGITYGRSRFVEEREYYISGCVVDATATANVT